MLNTSDSPHLTLPNVWYSPDKFGSHTTLRLNDFELHIINDLGEAGMIQAMTDGIIRAMKALGVAILVNNSSLWSTIGQN